MQNILSKSDSFIVPAMSWVMGCSPSRILPCKEIGLCSKKFSNTVFLHLRKSCRFCKICNFISQSYSIIKRDSYSWMHVRIIWATRKYESLGPDLWRSNWPGWKLGMGHLLQTPQGGLTSDNQRASPTPVHVISVSNRQRCLG